MRMRWWSSALFSVALSLPWVAGATVQADSLPPPKVVARAVELVDGQSGQVLYEKNSYDKLPMASVTKLMTLYIATKEIQQKKLSLNDLVPVSEEAYRVNGSQIWLEPGERMTVNHLLMAIAIGSANDAAYALGEYIAGSPETFVRDMNHEAKVLGMHATHFSNPHGLHQTDHYSTAHDLAILGTNAVKVPLLLHYTSMWENRSIRNGKGGTLWMINHNRLLRRFPGMDGLKTGFTSQAQFCMVATARRDGTRMLAVVLGAPSSKQRFSDAASLLTWGFLNYRSLVLAQKGQVAGVIPVKRGIVRSVNAVYQKDRVLTWRRNAANPERHLILNASLEAPIRKGQVVGELIVRDGSRTVAQVPLTAQNGVSRVSLIGGAWRYLWKIAG